ncbi:MAG: DUF5606 domain-containing protein [Bacteroidetes bacterium]|jgi:hypothetical protein|nr:DUF5606 domain-containing protein [Bacteroidota bacterium]
MSLKKIMSISGMPGLYKVVAQTKNGFIAESLVDKKRFPVHSNQQVSMLSDISIFTVSEDIKLSEVFKRMKSMPENETDIDMKADGATLYSAFGKVLPEFDKDRVYPSDIKKVFKWFNVLKNEVDFTEDETSVATEEPKQEAAIEAKQEIAEESKPAKKPAAKRKSKKSATDKEE